ncbi:MAG: hypothetical protein WDM90_20630 [Ferruginibacter sp.]
MSKIEILKKNELLEYEDVTNTISLEGTYTPKLKEFEKRNNNPLLIFLAGSLLWVSDCNATSIKNNLTLSHSPESSINFDTFLNNYSQQIDLPLAGYIEQILPKANYTRKELIKEILSFKSLNESWDGFGAVPLEVDSAANVLELIDLMDDKITSRIDQIYPNPQGTISIEWNNDLDETVFVEIGNNTMSYYAQLIGQDVQFFNNVHINDTEAKRITDFISFLG